jgi:hypothetical protein
MLKSHYDSLAISNISEEGKFLIFQKTERFSLKFHYGGGGICNGIRMLDEKDTQSWSKRDDGNLTQKFKMSSVLIKSDTSLKHETI